MFNSGIITDIDLLSGSDDWMNIFIVKGRKAAESRSIHLLR